MSCAPLARGRGATSPLLRLSLLGRDRADAELGGRTVQLSRRHSEVLALLSMRPGGMTSEELAADLYGDPGTSSTARVEVHRLRKLLGPWLDADPYRLSSDVESDVARVKGLLDRGAVREAVERYDGPLLPHSEAPGVVRERDSLDAWLRQAVMTADEADTLWAWVQSPVGARRSGRVEAAARAAALPRPAAQPRRDRGPPAAPGVRRRLSLRHIGRLYPRQRMGGRNEFRS